MGDMGEKNMGDKYTREGFTLIELLIVVGVLGVLSLTFMGLFNPLRQFQKSYDGKRKAELDSLPKIFENIYNDKNRFPLPAEVCFDASSAPRSDTYGKTACTCHICGKNSNSPPFSPYLSQLPCDPLSSQKEYLYDFDCASTPPDPQWFRIYTQLAIENDPDIKKVGCLAGCGPAPDFAYNYLVSVNARPEAIRCSDSIRLYQKDEAGNCNICKSPVGGDICNYNEILYNSYPCNRRCSP